MNKEEIENKIREIVKRNIADGFTSRADEVICINELSTLIQESNEKAEQRGFAKAWAVVKKLMSFSSPEEAEEYLSSIGKDKDE